MPRRASLGEGVNDALSSEMESDQLLWIGEVFRKVRAAQAVCWSRRGVGLILSVCSGARLPEADMAQQVTPNQSPRTLSVVKSVSGVN